MHSEVFNERMKIVFEAIFLIYGKSSNLCFVWCGIKAGRKTMRTIVGGLAGSWIEDIATGGSQPLEIISMPSLSEDHATVPNRHLEKSNLSHFL